MATSKTSNPDTTSERVKGQLFAYCETVRSQLNLLGVNGEKMFDEIDADMERWFKARIPPSIAAPTLMRRHLGMDLPQDTHDVMWKVEKRLLPSHDLGEGHVWTLPVAETDCEEVVDGITEILSREGIDELEVHKRNGTYYQFTTLHQRSDDDFGDAPEDIIDITPDAYSI